MGLPEAPTLIGTAGALIRARGIDALYGAFDKLSQRRIDLRLVLAGPTDRPLVSPRGAKIIYLGELPHQRVGDLFNALDVGVICNRDDEFGRYCLPQKLFEMLACKLPVVAADVGAMRGLVPGADRFLYNPNSISSLADAITAQLEVGYCPDIAVPTWHDCGLAFGNLMETVGGVRRRSYDAVVAAHPSAGGL